MNVIQPVSFYVRRDGIKSRVVAVMSDGTESPWGNQTTERGLKSCLSRYAKQYGFVVTGDTAQPALKFIKAQDVKPGDKIWIDSYLSMEVATVRADQLPDGETGYRFFSAGGACIWNRHNEELILA